MIGHLYQITGISFLIISGAIYQVKDHATNKVTSGAIRRQGPPPRGTR